MTINKIASTAAILAAGTTTAFAGGLERGLLPISPLFEEGTYAEVSTALVLPSVSGTTAGGVPIGNINGNYTQSSLSFKTDLTKKLALSVSYFQPLGTDILYDTNPLFGPLSGAAASLDTSALSAILKYKFDNNISIYGGGKAVSATGDLTLGPAFSFARDTGLGFIAGAAYEKPEIALRVSFTYESEIDLELDATVVGAGVSAGQITGAVPESFRLDFQTGIAKNTLLFGSIRNARHQSANIVFPALGAAAALTSFDNVTTYTLGLGRKLNDQLSVFGQASYEKRGDGVSGNLSPQDGRYALQLGGSYKVGKAKLTGGIRYTVLGDVTTTTFGNSFTNNDSLSLGFKVGYSF